MTGEDLVLSTAMEEHEWILKQTNGLVRVSRLRINSAKDGFRESSDCMTRTQHAITSSVTLIDLSDEVIYRLYGKKLVR